MPVDVGLNAKLKPKIDEKESQREVDNLEDLLDDVEELAIDADLDQAEETIDEFKEKLSADMDVDGEVGEDIAQKATEAVQGVVPGAGDGGPMDSAIGGAVTKMNDKLGGMMGGAGSGAAGGALSKVASKAAPVALAGAVGYGLLKGVQKMASFAPTGQKMLDMFGTAMALFFRPFGRIIGEALMPFARDALKAMADFNKVVKEDGLVVGGISFLVEAMKTLPQDIADALGDSISTTMENMFGTDFGLGEIDWGMYVDVLGWNSFVNPLNWPKFIGVVLWNEYLSNLNWGDWIQAALKWNNWVNLLTWGGWVNPLNWPVFIGTLIWTEFISKVNWDKWIDTGITGTLNTLDNALSDFQSAVSSLVRWMGNNIPGIDTGGSQGGSGDGGGNPSPGPGRGGDRFPSRTGSTDTSTTTTTTTDSVYTDDIANLGHDDSTSDDTTTTDTSGDTLSGHAGPRSGATTMARGGIVEKATQIVAGERGREAIVPLEDYDLNFADKQESRDTARPQPVEPIQAPRDGRESARADDQVHDDLEDVKRRLDRLVDAIDELDLDVSLEVDKQKLAETNRESRDKFIDERDVVR